MEKHYYYINLPVVILYFKNMITKRITDNN